MSENYFRPLNAIQKIRGTRSKPDSVTVTVSERGGTKLIFSRGLCRKLGIENEVYLMTDGDTLLVSGEPLFRGCPYYEVRSHSADRKVLFSTSVVYEVADILKLDFSKAVSQTITNVEYLDTDEGVMYAFVYN